MRHSKSRLIEDADGSAPVRSDKSPDKSGQARQVGTKKRDQGWKPHLPGAKVPTIQTIGGLKISNCANAS